MPARGRRRRLVVGQEPAVGGSNSIPAAEQDVRRPGPAAAGEPGALLQAELAGQMVTMQGRRGTVPGATGGGTDRAMVPPSAARAVLSLVPPFRAQGGVRIAASLSSPAAWTAADLPLLDELAELLGRHRRGRAGRPGNRPSARLGVT
jgi:hypothetical protein